MHLLNLWINPQYDTFDILKMFHKLTLESLTIYHVDVYVRVLKMLLQHWKFFLLAYSIIATLLMSYQNKQHFSFSSSSITSCEWWLCSVTMTQDSCDLRSAAFLLWHNYIIYTVTIQLKNNKLDLWIYWQLWRWFKWSTSRGTECSQLFWLYCYHIVSFSHNYLSVKFQVRIFHKYCIIHGDFGSKFRKAL